MGEIYLCINFGVFVSLSLFLQKSREKEINTLRIFKYWIFYHTVIETCFKMLKSSENEKLTRYSSYKSHNFLDCSKVFSWSLNFNLLSIPYIIYPLTVKEIKRRNTNHFFKMILLISKNSCWTLLYNYFVLSFSILLIDLNGTYRSIA